MKKKLSKIVFAVLFVLGVTAFIGCTKEDGANREANETISVITEENFTAFIEGVYKNFEENRMFIDEFLYKFRNNQLDKESISIMISLLNITEKTNVDNLEGANQLNGVYDLIETRRSGNINKSGEMTNVILSDCDKLLEIRDAMIEECNNYSLLRIACRSSVMIAYWWKSRKC